MIWIVTLVLVLLAIWAIARFGLEGDDLSGYDLPAAAPVNDAPSAGNAEVVEFVRSLARAAARETRRGRLARMRRELDRLGEDADLSGVNVTPVTAAGVPAEWLTARGVEPRGRLLYIHGGGFTLGSPASHRRITAELARRTHFAVLAIDYRLMPEHRRADLMDDCRTAYRWMLAHSPAGPEPAEVVLVAGDSAGGNLTLWLIAWLRDALTGFPTQRRDAAPNGSAQLRQADAAIVLSPLTDSTFASPSAIRNVETDPLLGAMAGTIARVPRSLMLWLTWLQNRIPPADPRLSPLRGDLSGLPPVLVQASEAEILIDDARRYVNRAREAGSPVELETWHGMVHVWPAFGPGLPESRQAFERMVSFVTRVLESRGRANAA